MTISTVTTPYHNYTGNGAVDDFAVTRFEILRNSDNTHAIQIYKTVLATGISTLLAETTDYTVALDGTSPSTGTITLVAGNLPSTHRISIIPVPPSSQEVNLQNAAVIDVEDVESALDKLTLKAQSLEEQISRAIVFAPDTLNRGTELSNLTSDQVDNLVTQLNTIATSDNSVSDFSIDSLTVGDIDITADYLPFHDTSTSTMKKGLIPSSGNMGIVKDIQVTNLTATQTVTISDTYTWNTISSFSVSTTASSSDTDKVFIGGFINIGATNNISRAHVRIIRSDGKVISGSDLTSTGRDMVNGSISTVRLIRLTFVPFNVLDENVPAGTYTYSVQIKNSTDSNNIYINRSGTDTDDASWARTASQIYLMRLA
jgi:hypothetical protein